MFKRSSPPRGFVVVTWLGHQVRDRFQVEIGHFTELRWGGHCNRARRLCGHLALPGRVTLQIITQCFSLDSRDLPQILLEAWRRLAPTGLVAPLRLEVSACAGICDASLARVTWGSPTMWLRALVRATANAAAMQLPWLAMRGVSRFSMFLFVAGGVWLSSLECPWRRYGFLLYRDRDALGNGDPCSSPLVGV